VKKPNSFGGGRKVLVLRTGAGCECVCTGAGANEFALFLFRRLGY
jgi:hypothetical protein